MPATRAKPKASKRRSGARRAWPARPAARAPTPSVDGYLTAIPYSLTAHPELAPAWLDHVALAAGFAPPRERPDDPFAYCDLGCGRGVSTTLLAAAAPAGSFLGIDAMAGHVAEARAFARANGIANLRFRRDIFEKALGRDDGHFDYIVCHGVYSWISETQRRHLLAFLDRFLRPGGLVYLSYNALPGWTAIQPVQRLLLEVSRRNGGLPAGEQIDRGIALVSGMHEAKSRSLFNNPVVDHFLETTSRMPRSYLVHEYLHEGWQPVYGCDVRRAFTERAFDHVGSCRLVESREDFLLRAAQRKLLDELDDPLLRDLVRDHMIGQTFRMDVYGRGARRLDAAEQWRRRLEATIAPAEPPGNWSLTARTPAGSLSFDNEAARAIAAALERGSATPGAIAAASAEQGITEADVLNTLDALLAAGRCLPADPPAAAASTSAVNRSLRERALAAETVDYQAAPCGALVRAGALGLLLLDGRGSRKELEARVLERLAAAGRTAASLFTDADRRKRPKTALRQAIRDFVARGRGFYRALGIEA